MKEDIYKLLKSKSPNLSLAVLLDDKIELDEKSKVLVSINWMRSGSPKMYEPKLIAKLGINWETYMNPLLMNLADSKLDHLIRKVPSIYNNLKSEEFTNIIEYIISDKLDKLESKIAPHGFTSSKTMSINTKSRKLMSYKITSLGSKREFMRVELEAEGYSYRPKIYLLETGEELSGNLKESSLTNLKGLMYHMSEDESWDIDRLDESINLIDFEPTILNTLMSSIKSKYGK